MDLKAICISAVLLGVFVIVPILLIMTEHQRRMARIVKGEALGPDFSGTEALLKSFGGRSNDHGEATRLASEVSALRAEIGALRGDLASLRREIAETGRAVPARR